MASTIQIRVDDDLKNKSDQLFKRILELIRHQQ